MKYHTLVTGGSGLVGNALRDVFKNHTDVYYASSNDADLTSVSECKKLFDDIDPIYVIHLAASVGGLYRNQSHGLEMYESNLAINTNVIREVYSKHRKIKRAIFCLSTCVFPDNLAENSGEKPMSEKDLHNGEPHNSNYGYAYAKRMMEVHVRLNNDLAKQENRDIFGMCIIPTNIYGPHDNFHAENSHVIPALIRATEECIIEEKPLSIRGSGKALRQFVYSKDVARVIVAMLNMQRSTWEKYSVNNSVIVSPIEEISIIDAARKIISAFDQEISVECQLQYSDGQLRKRCDNTVLQSMFPQTFQNLTPFEKGIRETIEWYTKKTSYNTKRRM